MKKRLIILGLTLSMLVSSVAYGSPIRDAQQKKSNAEANLNATIGNMNSIAAKEKALQAEIDGVDKELFQVLVDLDVIETDIENIKVALEAAELDLKEAKATESEQYAAMKERIQYMYENGDGDYFKALVAEDNFSDVLDKVDKFNTVYDTDRTMLIEYQNTKIKIENLIETINQEKAQLEEAQNDYLHQQEELERVKAAKQAQMADFDRQLANAKALANKYLGIINQQNIIITNEIARQRAIAAARMQAGAAQTKRPVSKPSPDATQPIYGVPGAVDVTPSQTPVQNSAIVQTPPVPTQSVPVTTPVQIPQIPTASSGKGSDVVAYASQFLGNPYVWGGTSLTNGADCSGFVQSVYKEYGVNLPHSSSALQHVGTAVSPADIRPGDIVCYSGHVAIYTGDGGIIHASSPSVGITTGSNYNYRNVVTIRRVID